MPAHLVLSRVQVAELHLSVFADAFYRSSTYRWILQHARPHHFAQHARRSYARVRGWALSRYGLRIPPISSMPAELCVPLVVTLVLRIPLLRTAVSMIWLLSVAAAVLAALLVKEECNLRSLQVGPSDCAPSRCCETVGSLLGMVSNACGCRCCRSCLRRYLDSDDDIVNRCRRARAWTKRCFGACGAALAHRLAYVGTAQAPRPPPPYCCPYPCAYCTLPQAALRLTLLQLHRRDELIARCPGGAAARGHAWVDCPEMSCVGVGYKGQETIMCFICERQWRDAEYGVLSRVWSWVKGALFPELLDGSNWRPCPHCGAAIVKNGGCDNMRCAMCDRAFRWGPTGNSTEGVVEAHAPPPSLRRALGRAWT